MACLKERLFEGGRGIGTFLVEFVRPSVPRILADAGFDFVVIDMEHGVHTLNTAEGLIASSRAAGIAPIVRIPQIDRAHVLRVLELGARGIMAPMIESPEDAERLFALAKYPPDGKRGTCLGTAHTDYRIPEAGPYLDEANREALLVGQIETRRAIADLDAILAPRRLDVAFVGPLDLSVSFGAPGDQRTPEFLDAVDHVLDRCREHDVVPGIFAADVEAAAGWIGQGFRFVACSGDLWMLSSKASEIAGRLRDC